MKNEPATKEEKCHILADTYGFNFYELIKYNENQIYMLFDACKDEDGNLRKKM